MMKTKIIVVVGPTAVGKTSLGITLAQAFNGEIISGDSQQVYKGLDIGTAKASPKEQAIAKHHLIDIREIDDNYSAFDFVNDATQAIEQIVAKRKVPIIVGGTGLYLQSLLEGYHLGGKLDQEALLDYRKRLEERESADLYQAVADKGIVIDQINRRRAIRALELAEFGHSMENKETAYNPLLIGLNDERQLIYERINARVDVMLESGILDEAKMLFENYPEAQASRAIGYKEFFPYFKGEISLEEASQQLKQNTRRFAKRQLTWFRNRMATPFYKITDKDYPEFILEKVDNFLKS
ncbi:tRNA (adenosine(37)-N6)-dimethylallyltransferase MiaA [Streptococcus iniae]|uniref:tRNA (adenosine(37)-N6)-dimethylallyltransferase MiaA n=1 Tax=Streptococcus iniae TaxID=1346 RepID=UPI002B2F3EDA|nr:tRNA (adenosine(37)-N6)-dimethylallyltransferase MiaA [Streptococcus iniae]WNZ90786.1 tRNA (adenosine(37)-N6)-dimethylallyltransferase MiaA [Streptococcus iniae]